MTAMLLRFHSQMVLVLAVSVFPTLLFAHKAWVRARNGEMAK
jgi:hypothetical protein